MILDVSVTGFDGLMETVGEWHGFDGTTVAAQFPECCISGKGLHSAATALRLRDRPRVCQREACWRFTAPSTDLMCRLVGLKTCRKQHAQCTVVQTGMAAVLLGLFFSEASVRRQVVQCTVGFRREWIPATDYNKFRNPPTMLAARLNGNVCSSPTWLPQPG